MSDNLPIKVLLVDDDLATLEIIASALEEDGFRVRCLSSVKDLNERIVLFSPSILVLDVEIGKDDGIVAASEIKCQFPQLPVLFISSHKEPKIVSKGIEEGAVYLKKPIEIDELEAYIRKYGIIQPQYIYTLVLGDFVFNKKTRELLYKGDLHSKLSPTESGVLSILYDNLNQMVSNEDLALKIWKKPYKEVGAQIYNITAKLRKTFSKSESECLRTYRGKGVILKVSK